MLRLGLATSLLSVTLVTTSGLIAGPTTLAAGTPVTEDFSSGYNGGTAWNDDWDESGDDNSSGSGTIEINSGNLRFEDLDDDSISRTLDLSAFTQGAVFSYTLTSESGDEQLRFEFRTGEGGTFTEIARSAANAPDGTRYSFVLTSAMIRTNAELRIRSGSDNWSSSESIEIDDLGIDNPVPNPDFAAACGTDVILILDESGSIDNDGEDPSFITSVESAVTAFVDSLEGTGSKMRITEFSNNGRDALIGGTTAFQPVDAGFNTAVQTYLTTPNQNAQEPTSYNPGKGQNNTNWQAGIEAATTPGSTATGGIGAPLVVFFTDGKPNTIGLTGNSSNNNGGGDNNAAAAAYAQMEALRSAGSHVLSVAVGNAFTDPAAFTRLTEITEAIPPVQIWDNPADPLDIRTTDVLGVEDFSALPNALREVVFALCAPSVALNKFNQNGEAVPNWAFDLTVESLTGPATNNPIVWVSPSHGAATAPSTKTQNTDSAGIALFQWTPGSLATPQPWDSTISFSEDLLDNWQIDPATYAPGNNNCTVKRLSEDDFTVNIVKTSPSDPLPGSVVTFKLQEGDVQNGFTDFIVGQADIVSCTVTNIEPIAIRVVKDLVPAADSGRFDLLINATVQAEDVGDSGGGATTNTEVPAGSTVTVSEIANNTTNPTDLDDYQSALSCPDATLDINTGTNGTFTAPPSAAGDSVACTFTNIRKTSPLTVDKTWDNAGLGDTVSISIDATNDASGSSTAQTANETDSDVTGTTVFSGETVGLAESFTTGSAANYNSSLACAYGASNTQIAVINSSIVIPPAAADSTIRCTFTNDAKPASITIIKDVTNTSNGFNTNVFDFAGDLGAFTLVDDGVGTADNSITFDNLVAGQYTVTETDANANGFGLEAINCGDATTTPNGTDGVTITLDQAASVTCTFVNQAEASLTITKTAAAIQPVAADSDTFTIAYDVVVTNTGPGTTTYDLSDRANFGNGATITNVEVNSTRLVAPLNNPTNPIVTNQSIVGGGTSHTYTIDITFDVAPNMVPSERNCVTNTAGQGTYNSATITFSDSTASDNDCVSLPDPTPTITKTIGDDQPAAVDDDTSTVEYAIVVANPGPGQAIYTLTDTPDFGTGATITRIEVELPGGAALIPDLPIVGGTIVSDEPIDAGSSETYIITVTFGVDASTTAANRRCVTNTPHRGAFNTATITFPGGSSNANDCGSIPEPNITTTKTIVGAPSQPVQVGTGFQYTVDYTVDVRNTGTGIGSYTLIDDPNFGGGVTIDSMVLVAPLPASANAAFGLGDLAIVSNQTALAPNTSETFTVRATFTVAAGTTVTQRDCTIGTDPGTGTFNTVTVTPNIGAPTSDDACVPIPDPNVTVTKNVTSGPTYNSTNDNYTISYDITATNNGNGPGTYDLADTPTFANGTTITNVTVDSTQIPTGTVDNPTNPIVNDEPIAAGNTHNYTATITFTVDPGTTTEQRDCTIGTDPGTGTLNTVTVTPNIGDPASDGDCGQIPNPGIGVTKTAVEAPAQVGSTNQYTVDYDIVVSNTGPAAGTYTLVDAPTFGAGVTIDSVALVAPIPASANAGFSASDLTIVGAPGAPLLAAASETFTVRATFTVAAGTTVTQRDCTIGTDPGTGTFNTVTVTPNIGDPASDNDCRPIPDPNVTVTKNVTSGPTYNSTNDNYTISYDITATNNGNGPGTYDLADTPTFANGTTITNVTVDSTQIPTGTVDNPTNPIVNDEPIAAGNTHNYTATITFTVDPGTTTEQRDCTIGTDPGTGTLNTVTVTPNIGDPDSGSDCSPVPTPQIKIIKTLIDGPTATAPGSSIWTATYELQIDNVGDGPGTYDLADRPGFATGLTISDHHSTSTDVPMNGDFNTALGNTSIATGIAIGPDGRHLVEVVVTFAATNSVDPADRVCGQDPGPGDATFNATTVTPNIGPPSSDHACGPLPDPEVTVIKTIRSAPIDNGDNTFTIVYAIDVTNAANAGPAAYDLADQASFSRGVTIKSQSVANMTPGSITVDPSFPTSGTIVIAEPIAASSTHSYEVTVVAKLAVDTGTTYQACSSTTGNAGEGLFNRALLTVDGTTTTDHACADIEGDLTIEKTDGGIELQGGDGPFGYTLTVINVGGASTGDRVTVTDQLPDQFAWVSFPSASGSFPFCTQAGQVLTCQLDASLVDAGGESTSFVVTARAREGIAANEVGYRNMSFVDSPGDPAPTSPSCSDIGTAVSFSAFTNPDNNVACDETPMRPGAVLAAGAIPTLPPTTTTQPPPLAPPIVPPQGLPATGSSDSSNALGLAALLLVLGSSLTFIVRRRQNVAQIAGR